MRNFYTEEAKEFISKRVDELKGSWDDKAQAISKETREKFDIVIENGNVLRKIIYRIGEMKEKIKDLNDSIPGKPKYTVSGKFVDIPSKHGTFRFTIEEIDTFFYEFSEKGLNRTEEEMIQNHELKPEAWYAIKGAFRLYKKSNVISPITAESATEEELDEKIEYATARHIDSIKGKMVVTHERKFKEEAKKAFKILGNQEYFLENLQRFLESYQPKPIDFKVLPPDNNNIKHFFLSDIHLGKMGSDEVMKRLEQVTSDIINSPEGVIYLTFGGDLAETLSQDGMHPGQITQGTDPSWGYGFDLMMNVVKVFEEMIIKISRSGKELHFNGICGNHGRLTGKNEDDKQRTGELAIYEMIKRGLSNLDIEFNYLRDVINTIEYGRVRFILAHGDGNFDKQSPEKIIVSHGTTEKYNVIMSGDKHNLSMKEGGKYTHIKTPALAGRGRYDIDMNLSSSPGYLTFKENEHGTVDIEIKRLQN